MATDSGIQAQVLQKLGGVTRQALGARVKKLKAKVPMASEDAVYVIAHGLGIDLSRRLDSASLDRVGRLIARLDPARGEGAAPLPRARAGAAAPRVVVIRPFEDYAIPGLQGIHALEAKRMAERAYPMLYLFENSARDLIDGVLSKALGRNWWDTLAAAKKHHASVAGRMKDEGVDAWHGKRGDHPLHYLDLTRLSEIVADPAAWPLFARIFPRPSWFEGILEDLNVSRRVVAHMNPLSDADIRQVDAGFRRWRRQLDARKGEIADLLR